MDVVIENLSKQFGKFRALDSVTWQVGSGMYGLLGPNGAGKTTLMKIITTLLTPSAGRITVGGVDVQRDPRFVRQHLGYIPQEFGFFRNLNAYETLDYIATMKNVPPHNRKHHIDALLEQVNLVRDAKRKVGGYSGGMRQRLGIAQALLGDPELIVVDEPTAGLDPEERVRFRNLLVRLSGQRTVILSTHIVGDIEASCVGVAVLNKGCMVFTGSPEALIAQAQGRVWTVSLGVDEYEQFEKQFKVISTKSAGQVLSVRVLSAENPFGRGVPSEAGLEEGYMAVATGIGEAVYA
jgi:ABC-2 type transport system ATP-binding protein